MSLTPPSMRLNVSARGERRSSRRPEFRRGRHTPQVLTDIHKEKVLPGEPDDLWSHGSGRSVREEHVSPIGGTDRATAPGQDSGDDISELVTCGQQSGR